MVSYSKWTTKEWDELADKAKRLYLKTGAKKVRIARQLGISPGTLQRMLDGKMPTFMKREGGAADAGGGEEVAGTEEE